MRSFRSTWFHLQGEGSNRRMVCEGIPVTPIIQSEDRTGIGYAGAGGLVGTKKHEEESA